MGLTSIAKRCEKLKRAKSSTNNALFLQQNKQLFGYIPVNGLPVPVADDQKHCAMEPLQAHLLLKNQDVPNYKGLQIPVVSTLNIPLWKDLLAGYWDTQLVGFLKYGFPLCIEKNHILIAEKINHKSALDFPQDVNTFLQEEIQEGAILGPFPEPPCNLHTSPFMTRDKPGSKNRRVIIDLSWPKGTSVNAGVDISHYADAEYVLTFPSIDKYHY